MSARIAVAKAEDFAEGQAKVVEVCGRDVAVFRDGDAFFAIDDCCPHAGASLAGWHVEGGIVTCPWHAWRFKLCDGTWADNPRVKTRSYPVEVIDGVVSVVSPMTT